MRKSVLAIAAHPDDIEFVMAGTLLRLAQQGWELHYCNVANGCCGSTETNSVDTARVRLQEAQSAAKLLGATFYPPLRPDLQIFYNHATHAAVTAVVRQARPTIVLTHALSDYMEDHQNAARLAVGGAFARGMPNFESQPACDCWDQEIAVYHAQPHGNRDPLGHWVEPTHVVDIEDVVERKQQLLACHQSQYQWLDDSQHMDSPLQTMLAFGRELGQACSPFQIAEGWRQHVHWGLASPSFDPLQAALAPSGQLHLIDQAS